MLKIEFQKKLFGYGKGSVGYAIETWVTFLGLTIVHYRPIGIRGIVKKDKE